MVLLAQALVSGVVAGGTYALVAVGLNLIFGVMEVVNFAHGAFMMAAMYAAFWAFTLGGLDPYLALLVILPVFFLIGAGLQRAVLNRLLEGPPVSHLLLTLSVMTFLEAFVELTHLPDPRSLKVSYASATLSVGPALVSVAELVALGGALALTAALYLFLRHTPWGKRMRAAASHKLGARACGIDVEGTYTLAFGLATALVAAAGVLVAPILYITPRVGHVYLLTAFVVVVVGGLGSFRGALLGGLALGVAESLAAAYWRPSMKVLVSFGIMLAVLMWRPEGLFAGRRA